MGLVAWPGQPDLDRGDAALTRLLAVVRAAPYLEHRHLSDAHGFSERVTPAEIRVIQALAVGLETTEAADTLGVSHHTIRTQIRTAKAKMRARTRAHLVALAIRGGLI